MPNVRQIVLEILSQRGPLSVDAIARAAHLSKMAMRYHLALLAREGLIVPRDAGPRGVVGRPQRVYALADGAHEHLPKQYNMLAGQLLDELAGTLGPKEAYAMLRRAGRRAALPALPLRRGTRVEARLNRAVKFLSERGYMARWKKTSAGFSLNVCNCPYRQVARAHREVCEMDVAMIGALLSAPTKMTRCIANDDGRCQFVIPKKHLEPRSR